MKENTKMNYFLMAMVCRRHIGAIPCMSRQMTLCRAWRRVKNMCDIRMHTCNGMYCQQSVHSQVPPLTGANISRIRTQVMYVKYKMSSTQRG